jgi:hypothetical protein
MVVMKKLFMSLVVIFSIVAATTAAYAASTSVTLSVGEFSDASSYLYVGSGHDLHIKASSSQGSVWYYVEDKNGRLITEGRTTPSTPKAYPRSVSPGYYRIVLICEDNLNCKATGSLND